MVNSAYSNKPFLLTRGADLAYRVILIGLVMFSVGIFTCGCGPRVKDNEQVDPAKTIVIKFSHVTAAESPKGIASQRFAELIRNRTGGRVDVQVFSDSSLYKDGEEFSALREGKVQMIAPATSKLSDIAPAWQVLDLPFLFSSYDAVHRFVDGAARRQLFSDLEEQGLVPLAFWDNGFKQMTNRVRPLVHPEDFSGLRFRVMMGSQVLKEQFRHLDSDPIPLAFSDVHNSLSQCRCDGQENTLSNMHTKQLYERQTYVTLSNHGFLGYVVLAEQEFWSSLPPDIRAILEQTMAEVTTWEREQAILINDRELDALQQNKALTIHCQTIREREAWRRALAPVYDVFTQDVGADLISAARQVDD